MKRTCILALLFATTAWAADQPVSLPTPDANEVTPSPGPAVFDCYHLNFSWGFSLSGSFVDQQGTIWHYGSRDRAALPVATRELGKPYFKATDLRAKLASAKRIGNVDAKILAEKSALIAGAAEGSLSEKSGNANDAGSSTCHAYVSDPDERVRDVELGTDGAISDSRTINDSSQARELLVWLKSIGVAQ